MTLAARLQLLAACGSEPAAVSGADPFRPPTTQEDPEPIDPNDNPPPAPGGDGDSRPVDPGPGAGDGDEDSECASSSATAQSVAAPVDIIWVIDASGSMLDEQKRVSDNLTKFANDITAASVDVRIVMLTESASDRVLCSYPDDPMEGTPLVSDPRYHYIKASVGSHNLLQVAVKRYDDYKDLLRPDSTVSFVFLTDDESNYEGLGSAGERAERFQADMTALLGRSFVAHTIASPSPSACSAFPCGGLDFSQPFCGLHIVCTAAAPGATYYGLADATGGLTASVCETDWTKTFAPLTEAVIRSAPLPCEYDIPPPPVGQAFDRNLVNVRYAEAEDASEVLPNVPAANLCDDAFAWHYNDDATKAMLCPSACNRVAAGGTLDIAFGCETIVLF